MQNELRLIEEAFKKLDKEKEYFYATATKHTLKFIKVRPRGVTPELLGKPRLSLSIIKDFPGEKKPTPKTIHISANKIDSLYEDLDTALKEFSKQLREELESSD